MINVHIARLDDGSIEGFSIEGHANFAKAGRDIVCAGVSAVTVGTVNSIEALTGVELDSKMKNGFLSARLTEPLADSVSSQVQLLLESMVVMLESIAASYGKYIRVEQGNN
ncbi:ribosomal-processing cysteine protease Prp [Paenibacillus sp. JX-17]|uniref:Ribosomal processing cysteine protease Prp n=1 Tax=Paenibacillus lacisoli TaxID=3064525 RepID=A0ABT9CCA8_9BACL|nr:ribosomal-processing cysteine protease Prp [Paenibacillus sp. JX-17]MDO7906877.1 ribosomal-processing cysteine protease Prp [Paenibacillus sp. JX-17]